MPHGTRFPASLTRTDGPGRVLDYLRREKCPNGMARMGPHRPRHSSEQQGVLGQETGWQRKTFIYHMARPAYWALLRVGLACAMSQWTQTAIVRCSSSLTGPTAPALGQRPVCLTATCDKWENGKSTSSIDLPFSMASLLILGLRALSMEPRQTRI